MLLMSDTHTGKSYSETLCVCERGIDSTCEHNESLLFSGA